MRKTFLSGLIALVAVFAVANIALAQDASGFTSCLTPTGTVVANYSDGVHGIPGQGSKIGKDTVYALPGNNAMQCFCGADNVGIQTNWMYAANLSENEIKVLENDGWIYIPDGSAWGLAEGAYLAKNITYACSNGSSIVQSARGDGRTDGLSDGRSDGLGSLMQTTGTVSLASTGNLLFIAEVFAAGVLMFAFGVFLRKRVN